ncbi:hypothetical protein BDR07DRAFT_1483329 [Suillus spraguei]|nr:hypothetical protein BDR07DRAFT_1483329 [Suillus spraguei]
MADNLSLDHVFIVVQNTFQSFLTLGEHVHVALCTQLGDAAGLMEQKQLCLQFLDSISQQVITTSVSRMITALDAATTSSSDPPDAPPVGLGSCMSQGSVGRPPIDINPADLVILNAGRVSHTCLAELYHCHPQTICCQLLDHGLSAPSPPVYVDEPQLDGSVTRTYHVGTSSDLSLLLDGELDQLILHIYNQFPSFGAR